MQFRKAALIFGVISAVGGALAILAPARFLQALWPGREMIGAELFVQGWGASLLGLAALAWMNRNSQDPFVCRSIALALFLYFGIAAAAWFADARMIGWSISSAAAFVALSAFASAFGYLRFSHLSGVRR